MNYGTTNVFLRRFFVWRCVLVAGVALGQNNNWSVNNPCDHNITIQWVNNPGYPNYGATVIVYQGNGSGPMNIGSPPVPGSSVLEVWDSGYGRVGSFASATYAYGGKVTDNVNCGIGGVNIVPNGNTTGSVQNSSPNWTVYQLLDNGNPTGEFVAVPAGGTGSINYLGPMGDNYTFQQMQNGTVTVNSSNGGSYGENSNGSINFTNAQWTPNPGSGGSGSYTVGEAGNNLTISNMNWSTNTAGPATNPVPTVVNSGYGVPTFTNVVESGSNSPISWQAPQNTNSLTSGTYQQGIGALYSQDSLDSQAIVDAIHQADQNNVAGNSAISNSLITIVNQGSNYLSDFTFITNALAVLTNQGAADSNKLLYLTNLVNIGNGGGGGSNGPVNITNNVTVTNNVSVTNDLSLTNNVSVTVTVTNTENTNFTFDVTAASNAAMAATSQGAATLQTLGDAISIDPGSVAGTPGDWTITMYGQTYDINPLTAGGQWSIAPVAAWIRTVSQWSMYGWFLYFLAGEILTAIEEASKLPQASAADDVPIAASGIALTMAAAIIGAITTLIVFLCALVTNSMISSFVNHPFASPSVAAVSNGLYLLDSVFDVGLCISLFAQRIAVRAYIGKAFFICAGVVRFMTG